MRERCDQSFEFPPPFDLEFGIVRWFVGRVRLIEVRVDDEADEEIIERLDECRGRLPAEPLVGHQLQAITVVGRTGEIPNRRRIDKVARAPGQIGEGIEFDATEQLSWSVAQEIEMLDDRADQLRGWWKERTRCHGCYRRQRQ